MWPSSQIALRYHRTCWFNIRCGDLNLHNCGSCSCHWLIPLRCGTDRRLASVAPTCACQSASFSAACHSLVRCCKPHVRQAHYLLLGGCEGQTRSGIDRACILTRRAVNVVSSMKHSTPGPALSTWTYAIGLHMSTCGLSVMLLSSFSLQDNQRGHLRPLRIDSCCIVSLLFHMLPPGGQSQGKRFDGCISVRHLMGLNGPGVRTSEATADGCRSRMAPRLD
jgi:hypothetical protein